MYAVDLGVEMEVLHGLNSLGSHIQRLLLLLLLQNTLVPDRTDTIPSFEKTIQTFNGTLVTLDLFHSERIYNSSLLELRYIQPVFFMRLTSLLAGPQPSKLTECSQNNLYARKGTYKQPHQAKFTVMGWSCRQWPWHPLVFLHTTGHRSCMPN